MTESDSDCVSFASLLCASSCWVNFFFSFWEWFYLFRPVKISISHIMMMKSSFVCSGLDFIYSQRGRPLIVVDNYLFRKNRGNYWRCIRCTKHKCKSRLILRDGNERPLIIESHTHGPEKEKIEWGRKVKSTVPTADKLYSFSASDVVQLFERQPHFDSSLIEEDDDDDEVML